MITEAIDRLLAQCEVLLGPPDWTTETFLEELRTAISTFGNDCYVAGFQSGSDTWGTQV